MPILGTHQACQAERTLHKGIRCWEPYVWCNCAIYQGAKRLPKHINVVVAQHCMSFQLGVLCHFEANNALNRMLHWLFQSARTLLHDLVAPERCLTLHDLTNY